ncbi:protein of unknown function [Dethiosulfatibacter aminovorans DSM 17477]|uniref:DUF3842 family protein n=1 Tax=Dethiosulfatibacter aminovorans DSM 17477 TaxID=1121476 RepID=A0A1M6C3C6_9FIRM|nr:DUF3842 family protein [Dethiosulfatibacter aminovorans]SHI55509.1 protein of unknown function [Dethiosulfatibacter aminovorans DSM 17477]
MRIAVVDGQGGGIGKSIVEKLRKEFGDNVSILVLGTNATATSMMMRGGANEGATGENAIVFCAPKVDIIMGPIGIVVANSMLGELTPKMAKAVGESQAKKVLIPLNQCNVHVADTGSRSLSQQIENAIQIIKNFSS